MSIECRNLKVGYGDNIIISDLSVKIPKGKITMVIGSNGCGKSTLLKSIGGVIKPKAGSILLEGKDIKGYKGKTIAQKLAYLPQNPVVPQKITVEELIAFGRFPYRKGLGGLTGLDQKIIDQAMEEVHLTNLKDSDVEELSGGQRQRVWIAMALAQCTDTLIFDEPTTYLDMAHQLEILKLLQELNRKRQTTILIVIHELNLASRFADHMIAMKQGKIICEGKAGRVVTKENLKEIYDIDAQIICDDKDGHPICTNYEML
ncbi:MAG: ABC transporter ATP-binding protein [Lachnospiraceae bacterium]|nr:ABC transporter ATP-binding protein [Lachnospiraceae bacterium]